MFGVSPTVILVILLAVATAGDALLGKLYVEAYADYKVEKDLYDSFVTGVKLAGDAQDKKAAKQKAADEKAKKEADDENAKTVAALTDRIKRLRADAAKRDSRGGSVSAAPAGSECPKGQTCFDTAEYQRAIGGFDTGTRRLADEGSQVEADLDTAKKWAKASLP